MNRQIHLIPMLTITVMVVAMLPIYGWTLVHLVYSFHMFNKQGQQSSSFLYAVLLSLRKVNVINLLLLASVCMASVLLLLWYYRKPTRKTAAQYIILILLVLFSFIVLDQVTL